MSGAWKALGEDQKVHCKSMLTYGKTRVDPTNDGQLVKALAEDLAKADVWITWYGKRFDVPYLNSRLIHHGFDPLPNIPHIDGWEISKKKLRIHSNRLASASAFLGLEAKTQIMPSLWLAASCGNRDALKYVVEHNIQDIVVLEQAYEKLKPLMTAAPTVSAITTDGTKCPICASLQIVRDGWYIGNTRKYQRYHCKNCGANPKGKYEALD